MDGFLIVFVSSGLTGLEPAASALNQNLSFLRVDRS